jgi:ABC-type uncharacterized transport system YnjBCD ATPase subunit
MTGQQIRTQRDQALACLVVAAAFSLATFASVFSAAQRARVDSVRAVVAHHETLLLESARDLQTNKDVLVEVSRKLDSLDRPSAH